MSMVNSDGLSLWVGDGAVGESFAILRGAEIMRLEIGQQLVNSDAISTDGWNVGIATANRRAMVECTALSTDEAQATRVRNLAMGGGAGNFRLTVNAADDFSFRAYVTNYREIIQGGIIKRIQFKLESTDAVSIV